MIPSYCYYLLTILCRNVMIYLLKNSFSLRALLNKVVFGVFRDFGTWNKALYICYNRSKNLLRGNRLNHFSIHPDIIGPVKIDHLVVTQQELPSNWEKNCSHQFLMIHQLRSSPVLNSFAKPIVDTGQDLP